MRYKISNGIEKSQNQVKKYTMVGLASLLMMSVAAVPAFAAGAGDGSHASACGAVHGAFADVNGNFGFLGPAGGTPGYHNGAVGQDPGATGSNNSHTNCQ